MGSSASYGTVLSESQRRQASCRARNIAHYSVEIYRYYARQSGNLRLGFGEGYPRYFITPKFRLLLRYYYI